MNTETVATKSFQITGHTILIIEDNPNNLGVIVDYLEEMGLKVVVARNGEMGLKRVKIANPDIILLDVMMPGIDGFETCRRLKSDETVKEIPVIFMTALDDPEDKLKGFEVGGVDYITKPIQQEEVLARLTTHLRIRDLTLNLSYKVEELTKIREELVQSEKIASLGRLVAGFAHELNTPLGVAVGSASTLQREVKKINVLMEQEEIDVDELLSALNTIDKGFDLTLSNLERAANLVTSFKRTAVDQTSDEIRKFNVYEVVSDTINILHSHFKKTDINIKINCPNNLTISSLPGALEQILTNLLMNSLVHGFNDGKSTGLINIKVQHDQQLLYLEYSDTGKGIAQENLAKIFEPFFTTNRAYGGSGLGMYICYNLVTTQLHGKISCESNFGKGTAFKINFPVIGIN